MSGFRAAGTARKPRHPSHLHTTPARGRDEPAGACCWHLHAGQALTYDFRLH